MAYMGQGHQPQEAHGPGETLKEESQQGKAPPMCLGGGGLLPWPPPPWRLDLLGAGAPPLGIPIYSGVGGPPKQTLCLWCSPSLSPKFFSSPVGAWRSPAGLPRSSTTTTPLCCCWMESSSTSPSLLAGSRRGRRHRAVRVLNAEVPCIRHLIIGDLNHDEYDSINPVHLNASAQRSTRVCRCTLLSTR